MAFQKKYYYSFKSLETEDTNLIEIWQDTGDVLVAEEVTGGGSPFVVKMPDLGNKFQTVRGTGCIIQLLSETDQKFFDGLYHENQQEFKVYHYINGVLNWCGYLNSEMFTEPYDSNFNYIVEVSGNDGLNLMERLFFNESDASKYTGLKTEWELLQIVFGKINLPYNDIRISLSTTFTGYTGGATETILHKTYLESSNFYDEDEKPMNLRDVVESILKPYGAFMIQSNGSIYITDINTQAGGGSVTYKQYNTSTHAYIADVVETNELAVSSIGYFGTGQQIEISGGTNRQVVRYSPYPNKDITEELIVTPAEFGTVPPNYSQKDGYVYKTLSNHFYYDVYANSDFEESAEGENSDDKFVYYRHPLDTSVLTFITKFDQRPYVNIESTRLREGEPGERLGSRRYLDGASILISGKVLVKTKDNPYDDNYSEADLDAGADKVDYASIRTGLVIGDKYFNGTVFADGPTESTFYLPFTQGGGQSISNKWIDFSSKLDLTYHTEEILIEGALSLFFRADTKVRISGGDAQDNSAPLKEIWIRNLKLSVVNNDGSEISDQDLEYIGQLNKNIQKEGDEVEITSGTASVFADRGKKCYSDGTNFQTIKEWTRAAQTYKIEELLLGSLSSNFRQGYITLTNMSLKNSFAPINVITDTYTGTRKLMQKSFSRDYYNHVVSCELVEVSQDELIIVKE